MVAGRDGLGGSGVRSRHARTSRSLGVVLSAAAAAVGTVAAAHQLLTTSVAHVAWVAAVLATSTALVVAVAWRRHRRIRDLALSVAMLSGLLLVALPVSGRVAFWCDGALVCRDSGAAATASITLDPISVAECTRGDVAVTGVVPQVAGDDTMWLVLKVDRNPGLDFPNDTYIPKTRLDTVGPFETELRVHGDRMGLVRTVFLVQADADADDALQADWLLDEKDIPAVNTVPYWTATGVTQVAASQPVVQTC